MTTSQCERKEKKERHKHTWGRNSGRAEPRDPTSTAGVTPSTLWVTIHLRPTDIPKLHLLKSYPGKIYHLGELGKLSWGIENPACKIWSNLKAYELSIFPIYFLVIFREKLKFRFLSVPHQYWPRTDKKRNFNFAKKMTEK